MLKVSRLSKKFDALKAVDDLSFEIEAGKITSIIGPNGSGKTTTINLLTGMMPFDKGSVYVNGTVLKKIRKSEVASFGITRTFQDVKLFEQMSVLDNMLVVLSERNVFGSLFEKHKETHTNKAEEILKKVGLSQKKNDLAYHLSYGQRKLLEVARAYAMMSAPVGGVSVFLFDEPFAGLFPEMVKIVSDILIELKTIGKTVILIEHDMDIVRRLSDKVIVMDSGSLLAEGSAEHVLSKASVVDAYIGK